jgi:hypothetical protein
MDCNILIIVFPVVLFMRLLPLLCPLCWSLYWLFLLLYSYGGALLLFPRWGGGGMPLS